MAATRLIALHKNKGKSVAACLKSRTDYVQNPDKTEQGELVSSYECSPLTVDEEFMAYMPDWILPVLLIAAFVSGLVGGLIGRKIFKKHFERAGIV